jgi:thiamine biosynthesis protein ThiS
MVTVNSRDQVPWRDGLTVQDVLDAMRYNYALITVHVNGELVERDDFATTLVPDGADLQAIHLAHGG